MCIRDSYTAAASVLTGEASAHPDRIIYRSETEEIANVYGNGNVDNVVENVNPFNLLPNDATEIPFIGLEPTEKDESPIDLTRKLMRERERRLQDGVILIPYYNIKGNRFEYPGMPFHYVNFILSLLCINASEETGIPFKCDIQLLCCLGDSRGEFSREDPVNVEQYCSVIPKDKVHVFSTDDGAGAGNYDLTTLEPLLTAAIPVSYTHLTLPTIYSV